MAKKCIVHATERHGREYRVEVEADSAFHAAWIATKALDDKPIITQPLKVVIGDVSYDVAWSRIIQWEKAHPNAMAHSWRILEEPKLEPDTLFDGTREVEVHVPCRDDRVRKYLCTAASVYHAAWLGKMRLVTCCQFDSDSDAVVFVGSKRFDVSMEQMDRWNLDNPNVVFQMPFVRDLPEAE